MASKTTQPKKPHGPTRLIGPEDIKPGDYVTIAEATYELAPCLCNLPNEQREVEPVRITARYGEAGEPLRVVAVSMPFVLCEHPHGYHETIDLTCRRLAKYPKAFGKAAFKAMKPKHE